MKKYKVIKTHTEVFDGKIYSVPAGTIMECHDLEIPENNPEYYQEYKEPEPEPDKFLAWLQLRIHKLNTEIVNCKNYEDYQKLYTKQIELGIFFQAINKYKAIKGLKDES